MIELEVTEGYVTLLTELTKNASPGNPYNAHAQHYYSGVTKLLGSSCSVISLSFSVYPTQFCMSPRKKTEEKNSPLSRWEEEMEKKRGAGPFPSAFWETGQNIVWKAITKNKLWESSSSSENKKLNTYSIRICYTTCSAETHSCQFINQSLFTSVACTVPEQRHNVSRLRP